MGRFLPLPAFREEYGCIRTSSAASGACVTLGKKLQVEQPIDSQFCEDSIIECDNGTNGRVVGVFDGHGGHQCSRVASAHLVQSICKLANTKDGVNPENTVSAFKAADERWCSATTSDDSGTTAAVSILTASALTVAHVGDSKVVKITRDGQCDALTKLHRAGDAHERELVLKRGGHIPEFSSGECARVNGLIEVTRSLGDRFLKPILDCTPDVVTVQLTDEDAFLVMGSDGLFDCVKDDALARLVNREAGKGTTADEIAFSLAKLAFRNGSEDDISVFVLDIKKHRELSLSEAAVVDTIAAVHTEEAQAACVNAPEADDEQLSWGRELAWTGLKWGACALAVVGTVLLARRWHR